MFHFLHNISLKTLSYLISTLSAKYLAVSKLVNIIIVHQIRKMINFNLCMHILCTQFFSTFFDEDLYMLNIYIVRIYHFCCLVIYIFPFQKNDKFVTLYIYLLMYHSSCIYQWINLLLLLIYLFSALKLNLQLHMRYRARGTRCI